MRETSISNQKRAVRALQWKHARTVLRVRDKVHHSNWNVLTIAGPAPHEEIACIRELMHQARITSVDIDPSNLELAIEAGADEVIQCDVGALQEQHVKSRYGQDTVHYDVPRELAKSNFDIICLDLTGPADDWLKRLLPVYFRSDSHLSKNGGILFKGGVLIVTFSYGRDVVEVYQDEWRRVQALEGYQALKCLDRLEGIPELIASRLWYLLRGTLVENLESCLQYRGGMMPMVSCLLRKGPKPPTVNYVQLASLDYELLVTAPNVEKIFACPAEELEYLRAKHGRSEAARKAIETRRLKENKQPQLTLVQPPPNRLKAIEALWQECSSDERAAVWKILHQIYTERKMLALSDPDVIARGALMREINHDREQGVPGAG